MSVLLLSIVFFLFDPPIVYGSSFKYNIQAILTHTHTHTHTTHTHTHTHTHHVTLKQLFYLTVAIRWKYRHALLTISSCDHIITFTFDVNITNINLYTSVFTGKTCGSKKRAESAEID